MLNNMKNIKISVAYTHIKSIIYIPHAKIFDGVERSEGGRVWERAHRRLSYLLPFREREEESEDFGDRITIKSTLAAKLGQAENFCPKLLTPLSGKVSG